MTKNDRRAEDAERGRMNEQKRILDITCGNRSIWFNKKHPNAIFFDRREVHYAKSFGKRLSERHIDVEPDVIGDYRELPFENDIFDLVVFDPPHIVRKSTGEESWLEKEYSYFTSKDEALESVKAGFDEGMRVLHDGGVLVLKWAETNIPTREIINKLGVEPLFGHRSGVKSGTHWMTFMKL